MNRVFDLGEKFQIPDGTFAPLIVIQNMAANSRIMSGKPVSRLVSTRSSVRSNVGRAAWPGRETARSAIRAA